MLRKFDDSSLFYACFPFCESVLCLLFSSQLATSQSRKTSQGGGQRTSGRWDCLWVNAGMFLRIRLDICINQPKKPKLEFSNGSFQAVQVNITVLWLMQRVGDLAMTGFYFTGSCDQDYRFECGWLGIDEQTCLARNCCWDNSDPSKKFCFVKKGTRKSCLNYMYIFGSLLVTLYEKDGSTRRTLQWYLSLKKSNYESVS